MTASETAMCPVCRRGITEAVLLRLLRRKEQCAAQTLAREACDIVDALEAELARRSRRAER